MQDDDLTDRWEACVVGRAISHEEHLRIGWMLVLRHGRLEAGRRLVQGTRANCEAMNASDRFDELLTRRWSDRIAGAVEADDGGTFEEFVAKHPTLTRSDLLGLPAWKVERSTDDHEPLAGIADWGLSEDWSDWREQAG